MANFFGNGGAAPATTPRGQLESRYASARANLLLVVVFTAVNLALLIFESGTYFLFSAWIPYLIVDLGLFECGRYPAEYYTGEWANMEFLDNSFFVVTLVVALVLILLYLPGGLLSLFDIWGEKLEKKKAVNDAKDEISGMAIAIAEKVVGRELNAADQKDLIDNFINELGDQV